jgi:hypothetical protein
VGTSKNVPSPDTPPWKPLLAILGRTDVPPERQAQEIWRSAYAERGASLVDEFASPAVAAACGLVSTSNDVLAASAAFSGHLATAGRAGFANEIARRALLRAVSTNQGVAGFARELFAEATSYYVSRDLPSFVGARGRVESVSRGMEFKTQIKAIVRTTVATTGQPSPDPDGWANYAATVIRALRGLA